jgi:hypothetical protein
VQCLLTVCERQARSFANGGCGSDANSAVVRAVRGAGAALQSALTDFDLSEVKHMSTRQAEAVSDEPKEC